MGEPSVVAAFDPQGERVAIGRSNDLLIMPTMAERPALQLVIDHPIERLRFHDRENVLAVTGEITEGKTSVTAERRINVTLIDLGSGARSTFELRQCRGALPCIAGAGAENGKLVPLHKYERLANVVRNGLAGVALLVTDAEPIGIEFIGAAGERLYMFKTESDLVVFDAAAQQMGRVRWNESAKSAAVARNKPVVAISSENGISVFQVEVDPRNGTRVALKRLRKFVTEDWATELALNDDASVLYYTAGLTGSSGRGQITAGAFDLESGRRLPGRFIPSSVRGSRQKYVANSQFDPRTGLITTQFVNGQTSEPLFSVPGVAVEFDPNGRFALMEMKNDLLAYGTDFDAARAAPARLRLVELSSVDSFANESRQPQGMRDECEMGQVALRTLSDRRDRLWNPYDWRRSKARRPATGTVALRLPEARLQSEFSLKWKTGKLELSKTNQGGSVVLGTGSAEEISRMVPEWSALIVPGIDMLITEITSADGRYAGVRRRQFSDKDGLDWTLYRIDQGERRVIKRGMTSESGGNFVFRGIFFIEALSVAAVQEDSCSVTFLALPDGDVLGKVRAAYDMVTNVVRIPDDLIAVVSSGRHDARQSIQIFDFPDLNPGPWFMTGDLQGDQSQEPPQGAPPKGQPGASAREAEAPAKPLVAFEWSAGEIGEDGGVLFLERLRDNGDREWIALAIPPWGERLRRVMLQP